MSGIPSRIQKETQRCYESLSQGLPLRPVAQPPQRVSLSSGLDSLSPPGLVALIHLRLFSANTFLGRGSQAWVSPEMPVVAYQQRA